MAKQYNPALSAFFTTVLILLTTPASAGAVYECETRQAFNWEDTGLKPDNAHFSQKHTALQFNVEQSVLWEAFDKHHNFGPIRMELIRAEPGGDIVAIDRGLRPSMNGTNSQDFVGIDLFEIKTAENGDLRFLAYFGSSKSLITGKCKPMDPSRHPLLLNSTIK